MRLLHTLNRVAAAVAFLACTLLAQRAGAQLTFELDSFPRAYQLYARDYGADSGRVPVSGWLVDGGAFTQVRLRARDAAGREVATDVADLTRAGDTARFATAVRLPAALEDYRVEVYGERADGTGLLLYEAERVVVGDVYYITGQSNAEAGAAAMPEDWDDFSRSFTYANGWNTINFSFPGQWGGRLAKRLIAERGVPVAIFNEAVGGEYVEFFLPGAAGSGHFERSRQRLRDAQLDGRVRACFWFQGEADGWGIPSAQYRAGFLALDRAWAEQYGARYTALYQLRRNSCGHPLPFVMEAQRQVNAEPGVYTLSTLNAAHDSCHFYYEEGYQRLGDHLTALVLAVEGGGGDVDAAGAPVGPAFSPDIARIERRGPRELALTFGAPAGEQLRTVGDPWDDFYVSEADDVRGVSGTWIDEHTLSLRLSGDVAAGQHLSYTGHPGPDLSSLVNAAGLGVLAFHAFPVAAASATGGVADRGADAPVVTLGADRALRVRALGLTRVRVTDARGRVVLDRRLRAGSATAVRELNAQLDPSAAGLLFVTSDYGAGATATRRVLAGR